MEGTIQVKRRIPFKVDEEIKLDIGCGETKQKGYIGIDIRDYKQEVVWDITQGIPFPDDSISEIYSHHCLEHIERSRVKEVWEEMYRVLKPDGKVVIYVPHSSGDKAFLMEHVSYWNERAVNCLCNKEGSLDHHTDTNFEIVKNERESNLLYVELKAIK